MPDGMGFTLQLPPIGNPELAMVAGMSAPLPADAASVAPFDANIPDTSLSLGVALQQPSHWQYDFDPVSGISRASYVGEVDTGGGDDEELVTFNGSVKIIGADPNPTLQLYSKADTIAWVSLLFYTLWTSNPGQAAQIGILRNAVQIWTWFFAESSDAADFRLIRHDMTTGANIDFPLIIPHASGNLQIGATAPPADNGAKLQVYGLPSPGGPNAIVAIVQQGATLPAGQTNVDVALRLQSNDGHGSRMMIDAIGANCVVGFRKANGSAAAPAAVQNNDTLGSINSYGFDGAAWSPSQVASMNCLAEGDWSATNHGAKWFWQTTPAGSTGLISPAMTLTGEGGLTFVGGLGAWNATPPATQPTVTGSRDGNAALASLLTALAATGLIIDGSAA